MPPATVPSSAARKVFAAPPSRTVVLSTTLRRAFARDESEGEFSALLRALDRVTPLP